jgi:poly(3-hydroxybutyrate) depolymerase
MGSTIHSVFSSVLRGLETGTSAVGTAIYTAARDTEDVWKACVDRLVTLPVLREIGPIHLLGGAAEGLVDLPLDVVRAAGAVLECADPVKCWELAAVVGIPFLRAVGRPRGFASEVWNQFQQDFDQDPLKTVGYTVCNPVGAIARLDEEATGSADRVKVMQVQVPGTNSSRPVVIYTPPGAKDTKDLPIFYFLHGTPGEPGDFLRAGGTEALNAWFKAGHKPFVVVEADGNVPGRQDSEWVDSADGKPEDQVESYFINAVIPAVEGDQPRAKSDRMIGGFSLGGYAGMNLALHHPDMFGKVASLDGYFHVDDTDGMLDVPVPGPNTIPDPGGPGVADKSVVDWNSPDQHVDSARGMGILLIRGTGDSGVSKGESERFGRLLAAAGIPYTAVATGGLHTTLFLQSNMCRLFQFMENEPVSPGEAALP